VNTKDGTLANIVTDQISVRRVDGEIQLSTTVKDKAGNLIVKITDNHWEVSSNKADCWDKNYTDNMLEVKNGRDQIVLQVRILPNEVQLQGNWEDRDFQPHILMADGQYDDLKGIKPIFKYPSGKYWSEFVDPNDIRLH
jgi:hypothetical protein